MLHSTQLHPMQKHRLFSEDEQSHLKQQHPIDRIISGSEIEEGVIKEVVIQQIKENENKESEIQESQDNHMQQITHKHIQETQIDQDPSLPFSLKQLPSKKRTDFKLWEEHLKDPIKLTYIRELILFILADGLSQKWIMLKNKSAIRKVFLCLTTDLRSPFPRLKAESSILDMQEFPFFEAGFQTLAAIDRGKIPHQEESLLLCPISSRSTERKGEKKDEKHDEKKDEIPQETPQEKTQEIPQEIPQVKTQQKTQQKNAPTPPSPLLSINDLILTAGQLIENKFPSSQHSALLPPPPICTWDLLAVDCEMVLLSTGESALARVSLVDRNLNPLYDQLVKPEGTIADYLTQYNGITAETLANVNCTLDQVHKDLAVFIHPNTVLVGHSLENDLAALKITHSKCIDTSVLFKHPNYPEYKHSLKHLCRRYLGKSIQEGAHDSVQDARACMQLLLAKLQKGPQWGIDCGMVEREPLAQRLARSPSGRQTVLECSESTTLTQQQIDESDLIVCRPLDCTTVQQVQERVEEFASRFAVPTLMLVVNGQNGVARADEFFARRRQRDGAWTEGDESAFQVLCGEIRRGFCLVKLKRSLGRS